MTRSQLERHQVWIYASAIAAGLVTGILAPAMARHFEVMLWPALGVLLYATFAQIPLTHLPGVFRDVRFVSAVLAANFVVVPILVAALLPLVPDEPAVRVGVLLVLLAPCTDWFITFTHLGGGDAKRALAITPIILILQLALLPMLLWTFIGHAFLEIFAFDRVAGVFVTLIVAPLLAAYLTERLVERRPSRHAFVTRLAWLPVPLLGVVVFLIAASQVHIVTGAWPVLGRVTGVFLLYLVVAGVTGTLTARVLALPARSGRTLVFSLGTRNSFLVLPFALALPGSWDIAIVVIVLQSIVELWGMVAYLWIVPRVLPIDERSP